MAVCLAASLRNGAAVHRRLRQPIGGFGHPAAACASYDPYDVPCVVK
jgi:hypothetical protein